jgi:hypothetical protein
MARVGSPSDDGAKPSRAPDRSAVFHVRVRMEPLQELIERGDYDSVSLAGSWDAALADRDGPDEVDLELIHFGKKLTTNRIYLALADMSLRPADARELLSFGISYPLEQRRHPIVGLGTRIQYPGANTTARAVLVLGSDATDAYRALQCALLSGNESDGRGWSTATRFAVVRLGSGTEVGGVVSEGGEGREGHW